MTHTLAAPDGRHSDPRAFSRPARAVGRFELVANPVDLPSWVVPVTSRLSELLDLPPNWNGTAAAPVEPRLAELAVNAVLASVMPEDCPPLPQVVPCIDGGLQLEWHRGGWDVEVQLTPMGEIWVDASEVHGDIDWDGDFASRREDLKLVLKSIS
jgi:hypothetical protein